MDTDKKKLYRNRAIKIVAIVIMSLYIGFEYSLRIFIETFLSERNPNEEMQRILDFLNKKEYIGLSREECEELLGEEVGVSYYKDIAYTGSIDSDIMVFSAGRCEDGLLCQKYILYLFFDENGCVKDAKMFHEWDW